MKLHRASAADVPAITACVDAAYTPWVADIGIEPGPLLQDYAAVVEAAHVVVAEDSDTLVGVLVLRETASGLLLDNVAVLPSYEGRGVGKALLLHAEEEAKRRGHRSLYLYTHAKMARNIALYHKIGYVEFDRRHDEGLDRVFMRKTLA